MTEAEDIIRIFYEEEKRRGGLAKADLSLVMDATVQRSKTTWDRVRDVMRDHLSGLQG